jgi:hypothetical protein
MFQTIISKKDGLTFHGYISERQGKHFTFSFRANGKNYKWDCDTDFWRVVE